MYIKETSIKTYSVQIHAGMIGATVAGKGPVQRWELPWSQVQPERVVGASEWFI